MTPETKSQEQLILQALLAGRKLTPIDALNDFSCFRLGARIFNLKAQGVPILDEWFTTASGKKVKAYFMNVSNPAQPELFS
jgi:hypothetical protein